MAGDVRSQHEGSRSDVFLRSDHPHGLFRTLLQAAVPPHTDVSDVFGGFFSIISTHAPPYSAPDRSKICGNRSVAAKQGDHLFAQTIAQIICNTLNIKYLNIYKH